VTTSHTGIMNTSSLGARVGKPEGGPCPSRRREAWGERGAGLRGSTVQHSA
jgi:hypothetical protein